MKRLATILACGAMLSVTTPASAQFFPYFAPEGGPAVYYEYLPRYRPNLHDYYAYAYDDYRRWQAFYDEYYNRHRPSRYAHSRRPPRYAARDPYGRRCYGGYSQYGYGRYC